jgi:hypothetical protein
MKLQIILQNSGFITVEIMIALSLFILFTISSFSLNSSMQGIKTWSINELSLMQESAIILDNTINDSNTTGSPYGNNSIVLRSGPFSLVKSHLSDSWGGSTCSPRINFDPSRISYYANGTSLGAGNIGTDIEARNSILYLTADSATQSLPDFFIIDAHNSQTPTILSAINTGPGISSVAIAGPYAYIANTSSVSQLQIIDMHNRRFPHLVAQLRIPLPEASTTPTRASTIYYKNGFVYLGTSKWDGAEFYSIDVSDPHNPTIIGSFETNTLINDIFVHDNYAYLATSDESQMRVIDISDKANMSLAYAFTASGWQVQQGKVVEYFENILGLGRTVGGINRTTNHEVFIFSTSTNAQVQFSKDIPGGVYGFIMRPPFNFLITHAPSEEFQVWNTDMSARIYQKPLGVSPVAISCDWSTLYMATGDERGFVELSL